MDVVLPIVARAAGVIPVVAAWVGAAPLQPPSALSQALSLAPAARLAPVPLVAARALPVASSEGRASLDYAAARALFESASDAAPTPAEMLRWRAGRLYKPERPNDPLNSLLVGAEVAAPEGRGLRVFPIQTTRPVDEIPTRPDLRRWVQDTVKNTPVLGPGPEFSEKAVRFGVCLGGVCHRYEVRRKGGLVLLRYRASAEASGEVVATWYGLYPKDVTP
ncbi:MAG: hypothetical protein HY925_09875 [Elusimicrobia bacterium]|nr:hypothetical protein [Elusimicrobiota bacterium]